VLFSIGSAFLYYVNHFKLYSSFCASHSKAQKALHPTNKSTYSLASLSISISFAIWYLIDFVIHSYLSLYLLCPMSCSFLPSTLFYKFMSFFLLLSASVHSSLFGGCLIAAIFCQLLLRNRTNTNTKKKWKPSITFNIKITIKHECNMLWIL
jgi:hypothetical protein